MISRSGALGGLLVGTTIYASLGPRGFAILALFVIGGSLLTRLGYASKARSGIAQEHGGRRGARNALANCAVPTLCAILAAATESEPLTVAFVASLGAAFADTAESEIGQLFSRTPRLITTLQRVPPGTDGAISVPGTLAGVGAAGLTAVLGLALGMLETPGSRPPHSDSIVPGHGSGQPDRGPLVPRRQRTYERTLHPRSRPARPHLRLRS